MLFHRETGWEKVKILLGDLSRTDQKALFSRINWGEFYYVPQRGFRQYSSLSRRARTTSSTVQRAFYTLSTQTRLPGSGSLPSTSR